MAPTITFFVFAIVAAAIVIRLARSRGEDPSDNERPRSRLLSARRQRKLDKVREFEASLPPRPTIQELMATEARETGVESIPGGDGLELPIRLRVWHRDVHVRAGCAEGGLRYVVHEGVEPTNATDDDVMLVCDIPADPPSS